MLLRHLQLICTAPSQHFFPQVSSLAGGLYPNAKGLHLATRKWYLLAWFDVGPLCLTSAWARDSQVHLSRGVISQRDLQKLHTLPASSGAPHSTASFQVR